MLAHPALCETLEQRAHDLRGERVREREHKGHHITLRTTPDGLFLAKFYQGAFGSPQRFLGETADQAEQFAVEYIDTYLSPDTGNGAGLIFLPGKP